MPGDEYYDKYGPTIITLGQAADAVASDVHKAISYATLVRGDLKRGKVHANDAAMLQRAGEQLMARAGALDRILLELAEKAR